MSANRLLAPIRKRWGLSHSSPSSSFIRVSHTRDSCAVRMPPAGLKPTWGTTNLLNRLDDLCKRRWFGSTMGNLPYSLSLSSNHGWPAPLLWQQGKWHWQTPCQLKFWWSQILVVTKYRRHKTFWLLAWCLVPFRLFWPKKADVDNYWMYTQGKYSINDLSNSNQIIKILKILKNINYIYLIINTN